MENCVFCKIVKGEIPSEKIWEDDNVLAFLDINPLTKGHALVIPKKHFENIFDIDENVLERIISAGKNLAQKSKAALGAVAVNLLNSSGSQAGQKVMHFHLHVIPRYENDGVIISAPRKNKVEPEELKEISSKLR